MKRFAFPVTSPVEELGEIERPVGKRYWTDKSKLIINSFLDRVICYMKKFNLKYGFLTTYRVTVFILRVEDYKFEVPPPVDYRATQSSLRECYTAFTALADDDLVY